MIGKIKVISHGEDVVLESTDLSAFGLDLFHDSVSDRSEVIVETEHTLRLPGLVNNSRRIDILSRMCAKFQAFGWLVEVW